ncbi:MAG TPA: DNA mismatch repair protein MutL, partial [Verrucomicrobiae bacterium]|nr:DNA mismatch repair protein MutL [Verrucomicrobiae bacterium]
EIDPAAVDVNIHPAKREVKFHQEAQVRRLVAQAVRETLLKFHAQPERNEATAKAQKLPMHVPESSAKVSSAGSSPAFANRAVPETEELPRLAPATSASRSIPPAREIPTWPARAPIESPRPFAPAVPNASAPAAAVPLLNVPLRLVGVIGRLYVVLESDRGLVLLDQHAAHERILFEQMLTRLEQSGTASSQKLLLPETVELSARDAHFLRGQLPGLARLGVGLSEFGERTFLLDALPPFVKVADSRRFVLELVDELKAAGAEVNALRLGEHTIAKTVCRHAVKANDPLAGPELENLVNDLRHCSMPYTCPHGRPTLIEMNYRELEKKFGRVQ